jgi:hypothetical protein
MNRLRDELSAETSSDSLAQRLVRATRPLEVPLALRRDVRRGLPVHPRLVSFRLRTAVAAMVMLCVFGVASAMTARWLQKRRSPPVERREEPAHAKPSRAAPATPAPTPSPSLLQTPSRSANPAPSSSMSATAASPGAVARPAPRATAPSPISLADVPLPAPSATASDELVLYLDGVDALRGQHDPSTAARLFARYREAYPGGSFVEDSFALSMEAASLQGHAPHELATAYLARFPRGRYRKLATQVLAR